MALGKRHFYPGLSRRLLNPHLNFKSSLLPQTESQTPNATSTTGSLMRILQDGEHLSLT